MAAGFISTRMTETLTKKRKKKGILDKIPMGRMGTTKRVLLTRLYFSLISLSNYITGQVITVDGGMVM